MINDLSIRKDPGPMGISAAFLQFNIETVAPILVQCINTIFLTGRIPTKKGAITDIENYRGIAIQSCIPKLLDRIITRILYETLESIIDPNQHGFMRGKSTQTNLAEISQFIHNESRSSQIDVIYFDFSKAFDQIRHDLLAVG